MIHLMYLQCVYLMKWSCNLCFGRGYPSLPVYCTKSFKDTMFILTVRDFTCLVWVFLTLAVHSQYSIKLARTCNCGEFVTLMDYWIKELQDEEFMSQDWESLMSLLSIAHSCICIGTIRYNIFPLSKWSGVWLLLASQGFKSLLSLNKYSRWIHMNRLLITLFMPYHSNIISDVFVDWLSK